jgi:NAD-dependent deacetylase
MIIGEKGQNLSAPLPVDMPGHFTYTGTMKSPKSPSLLKEAALAWLSTRVPLALTGAGISVESGIPDFRSSSGLWTRYSPDEYATMEAFLDDPVKVWHFFRALGATLEGARPNKAHFALAELEREGRLAHIITQNIDGLHEMAGSRSVLAMHGSQSRLQCIHCGWTTIIDRSHYEGELPRCRECRHILKPDVVLFGENIRHGEEIDEMLKECDALLVIGTSAQVYPAGAFPRQVRKKGGLVLEFNMLEQAREKRFEKTLFITRGGGLLNGDYFFEGPATLTVPRFAEEVLVQRQGGCPQP